MTVFLCFSDSWHNDQMTCHSSILFGDLKTSIPLLLLDAGPVNQLKWGTQTQYILLIFIVGWGLPTMGWWTSIACNQ
jgi:hypothetical protein